MGGVVSSGDNNDALVDNLIRANYIKSPKIERVFRAVDRAFYYTDEEKSMAYKDLAWKSRNLHLSAPCIYSQVMEHLELKPGISFLNLGSGTGYLSTMVGLILGCNGINHGLEIHSEVIEYANEKVQAFMNLNSAIDEYEFCIPQFEKGNCLSLVTERRYDRIYCGAGCPETYNDNLRQLVEVGGILVMPMNDQLLQIRRLGENSWDENSVLPVSFASLVLPPPGGEDVVLPPINPHSLQDICRFEIRALLKEKVKAEHPDLWNRCRKHPKEVNKRPNFRRCVVPLFAHSDSDSDSVEGVAAEVAVNEQAQPSSSSSSSSSSDDKSESENEAMMPQPSPSVERRSGIRLAETLSDIEDGAKTKREKFDSGVSDLFESSSDRSPSTSDQSTPNASSSSSSTTVDHNPASNSSPAHEPSEDETTTDHSLDFDIGEDRGGNTIAGLRLFAHSMPGERDAAALVIFENHLGTDTSDEEEEGEASDSNEAADSSHVTPAEDYSYYMKRNLLELPLPLILKSFLNYNRSF